MTETDYDRIDYGSHVHRHTCPNRLAGIARLLGMPCASPARARVLELGCGSGSNLISLAWYWPGSEFVGIDLAQVPIDEGRLEAQSLGLRNLRLEQGDIAELRPETLGGFDFVIAHGVMSWVPEPVRIAMMALIARCLNPNGLAYLSYNAQPGSRIRHIARDLMLFDKGEQPFTRAAAERAFSLLDSVDQVEDGDRPDFFRTLLEESRQAIKGGVNYLFHDDFGQFCQPYYLHEVAALASHAGLGYLGDASVGEMFEPEGFASLTRWLDHHAQGNWLRRQQFLDFAMGTRFRRSLLCRAQDAPHPRTTPHNAAGLHYVTDYRPREACRLDDDSEATFVTRERRSFTTRSALLKSLLSLMATTPSASLSVPELAARLPGGDSRQTQASASEILMRLSINGIATPLAQTPPAVVMPAALGLPRPTVTSLARHYLAAGRLVDNLHGGLTLSEPWLRELLLACDGSRDLEELTELARTLAASHPPDPDGDFAEGLPGLLRTLARRGLLSPQ